MTTITHDATTITPTAVLGYKTSRASRNVFHDILGRADDDVTLRPPTLRAGQLELGFAVRSDAWAAIALHALPGRFVLADADVPQVNMTYVIDGSIDAELEDETRSLWIVTVGYREVPA